MQIFIAILVFSVIVIIHEIGHFVAARKCGVTVVEFSVGMGPKLFGVQKGETFYSLRLFPIGGSCRMLGEDIEPETDVAKAPNPKAFTSKSVSKRFIIISAGIIMNILLAFIITTATVAFNGYIDASVGHVAEDYPAESAGLKVGDRFSKVNGSGILLAAEIRSIIDRNGGSEMTFEVIRDGERIEVPISPLLVEDSGTGVQRYVIGISYDIKIGMFENVDAEIESTYKRATLGETISMGAKTCVYYVKATFAGLGDLITRKANVKELSGPIGIVNMIGDTYETSISVSPWVAFWNMMSFMAALSVNLAVFNFLPIPALDGGRMVFLAFEGIRGKPISPEREGIIHFAGFVLLMIFAVFVAYNDIMKLI